MFCEKLKFLRKHQELTQAEVAKQISIDNTTYCRYEKGIYQPDYDTLKRIAKFFDCTIDYLLEMECANADSDKVVDLNNFLLNGRYTINSKFLNNRERKRLSDMVRVMYEDK